LVHTKRHPDDRPIGLPVADELLCDASSLVRRYREADTDVALLSGAQPPTRDRPARAVDANPLGTGVAQWTARVTRVDCGVRLDGVDVRLLAGLLGAGHDGTVLSAHDARRDSPTQAKRRADRDDRVTDLHVIRVAQRHCLC